MKTRAFALAAFFGAAALASCSPPTADLTTTSGLTFVADPNTFFLATGESETVTVSSFPISGTIGTVKWSSSDKNIVTVDSVVEIGAPATVRAVSVGTAAIKAIVSSNANQVEISVPVRVRAGG